MGQALNFYKHHIGDYDAATAHLSWDEDQAYTRLLRVYYRTEKPLPKEPGAVYRLVRAITRGQKAAVTAVLHEFFQELQDGWHNKRADEEIAAYLESEEGRAAKKENEKERQRRHRARRKELFETLRRHDIVPAFDTPTETLEAMVRSRDNNAPVTRDATANQNQIPEANSQMEGSDVGGLSKKPLNPIEKSEDQQRDVRSLVRNTAASLTRKFA